MSDANAPKKDEPKLTWIDIAITVTLLASIVGLAAWLLSGRFSYVAAPASSFGLVNLLKKPKDEDADAADSAEDARSPIDNDRPVDVKAPLPLIENPNDPLPIATPDPVLPPANLIVPSDPFDGSLLEPTVPPAIAPNPIPTPAPTPASPVQTPTPAPIEPSPAVTASATKQPIRYLRESYAIGIKDFQGLDLRNVELNYEDLRLLGVDLREVKAERASLQQIDLTEANLGRADLQYAKLDGANLSYTNLSAANLSGATLCGANLRDAKLNDARLALADLSYADLSGADLSGADLTDTNLFRARLDGTKLPAGMARP